MRPDEVEAYRHQLCCKSVNELTDYVAQCTATRLQYVRRMVDRPLTGAEQMQLDNVEELQDLVHEARAAMACMQDELPYAIAPRQNRTQGTSR